MNANAPDKPERCLECNALIAGMEVHGLCPTCLLERGLGAWQTAQNEPSRSGEDVGAGSASTEAFAERPTRVLTSECRGTLIGHYKLLQRLGEGGMGEVWMAEQTEHVNRRVALKIIKAGMDTKEVIARFEVERQALAMMDHPNIAKVLDAGATEFGRPFFVMELVRGMPLTDFCDDQKLDTRQRLELFAEICSAVNHAHQKGIIHRDLKPSNILVTLDGDRPVPKVIDFGIAKATQEKLTDKTLFTRLGQFVGTPVYMSPEQAALSGLDIDTRSDIYSLGVILYEILTSKPPFDTKSLLDAGYDEMRRIIRDEEPPRPSTRLRALKEKERPTVAATHRCETKKLERLIRGDLDWIVMKALEKDRARRYETANALGQDIRRHLTHQPVSAVAPSLVYTFCKFARRHAAAVTLALGLLASLILGLAGALSGIVRVQAALESEADQRQKAQWERDAKEEALATVKAQRDLVRQEADRNRQLLYASDVLLSSHMWQSDDGTNRQIADLLKRSVPGPGEEDLREFTWRYQWTLLGRGSTMHHGPKNPPGIGVNTAGHAVTLNNDGVVELWESSQKAALPSLRLNGTERPQSAALSRNSELVAVILADGTATLRKATGETIHSLGIVPPQRGVKFSANDRFLGAIGEDARGRIWNVETGALLQEFSLVDASFVHWDFSGDGPKLLLTNHRGFGVTLYCPPMGAPHVLHDDKGGFVVYQGVISADGRLAAAGNAGGDVMIWDTDTRTKLRQLHVPSAAKRLALSSEGDVLAIGETAGQISLWNMASGERLRTLKGHEASITRLIFSHDGKSLASIDAGGVLRCWNLAQEDEVRVKQTGEIDRIAYSPDGKWMAVGGRGRVLLTDLKTGGEPVTIDTQSARVVTFSPDSRLLAAGGTSGELRLWKLGIADSKQTLPTPELSMKEIGGLAIGGGSAWVAVSYGSTTGFSQDHEAAVAVWDLQTRERAHLFPTDSQVSALTLGADGRLLAAAAHNGVIRVWSTTDWQERARWSGPPRSQYQSIRFLDDGRTLCTGSLSGRIDFWDPATQALKRSVMAHSDCVSALAVSPDGKTLATGSWDSAIKLWHVATGRELRTLRRHHSWVYTLAFAPDGDTLASGGVDGWLNLFPAPHSNSD